MDSRLVGFESALDFSWFVDSDSYFGFSTIVDFDSDFNSPQRPNSDILRFVDYDSSFSRYVISDSSSSGLILLWTRLQLLYKFRLQLELSKDLILSSQDSLTVNLTIKHMQTTTLTRPFQIMMVLTWTLTSQTTQTPTPTLKLCWVWLRFQFLRVFFIPIQFQLSKWPSSNISIFVSCDFSFSRYADSDFDSSFSNYFDSNFDSGFFRFVDSDLSPALQMTQLWHLKICYVIAAFQDMQTMNPTFKKTLKKAQFWLLKICWLWYADFNFSRYAMQLQPPTLTKAFQFMLTQTSSPVSWDLLIPSQQ